MDRLADFILRYRYALMIGVAIATALAIIGERRLLLDEDPRNIIRSDDPEYAFLEDVERTFGSDDLDCIVVVQTPDIFSPPALAPFARLVEAVRGVPGVENVQSLLDIVDYRKLPPTPLLPGPDADPAELEKSRQMARAHPFVHGQLLSEDGRTTLIIARLDRSVAGIEDIRRVVDDLAETAAEAAAGTPLEAQLTGVPALRAEVFLAMRADEDKFTLIGCGLGMLMAVILFRRPTEILIVGCAAILGALWTLGAMGWAGEKTNVINVITPTLILVIGFEDAIHVMLHIQRARGEGLAPLQAARSAITHLAPACFMTALTTAIGFGSLVVAEAPLIRRLGLACAGGCFLALTAVLIVVPVLGGGWLGRFVSVQRGADLARQFERVFTLVLTPVLRHARAVTAAAFVLTLAFAAVCLRLKPDNAWEDSVPQGSRTLAAWKHVNESFGGAQSVLALVSWPQDRALDSPDVLERIAEVERLFDQDPATHYPLSILSVIRLAPGGDKDPQAALKLLKLAPPPVQTLVARFVREDQRRALVMGRVRDTGERDVPLDTRFHAIRSRLAQLADAHPGFSFRLTGTAAVADRSLREMIVVLAQSLLTAAAVIFAVMALAFRSIRLGLVSIVPNLFPLGLVGTLLVVSGEALQLTSVIVFSISLGLAVDNTIHFVTRFRREVAKDGNVGEAVHRTSIAVGWAIITATLVLVVGFAGITFSSIPALRMFALLSCLALGCSILGALVILPAMLLLFARVPRHEDPAGAADQCRSPGT